MTSLTTSIRGLARTGLLPLLLLFGASESHAQFDVFITGQVVDSQGLGVPGVDIDVDNKRGGGDPVLLNDGTDPGGFFTTTVEHDGTFDFLFRPPPPPTTSLLLETVADVTLAVGTTNLGVITLGEGVGVLGTCVGPTGLPAGNVNFDFFDADGDPLQIAGGFTSLFGTFSFVAPAGPIEWRMSTLGVISETLAPTVIYMTFAGTSMDLGNIVLPRGYHFLVNLMQPDGSPVVFTDTDVFDSATGDLVYTPGDNSDGNGDVDLILAAGTYDMVVCPAFATGLMATGSKGIPITADFDAGTFVLQTGVVLSGIVHDNLNQPLQGVNIDIENTFGDEIYLCGDSTKPGGIYELNVPPGTWRLEYNPSYALPLGASIYSEFTISGNMVNDVVLPACPTHTSYGTGLPGKNGFVPTLSASGGSARLGNPNYALEVSGAVGQTKAAIVSSFASASLPFFGGTLLVGSPAGPNSTSGVAPPAVGVGSLGNPARLSLVLGTRLVNLGGLPGGAGTGSLTYPQPIPNNPLLVGFTLYVQVLVIDSSAIQGVALTNGIAINACE